jgi:hypothetical protein
MEKVKTMILATVIWFLVSMAAGLAAAWYISTRPMGPRVDEARYARAVEMTGTLAATGIGGTWFFVVLLPMLQSQSTQAGKKKKKRRRSGQAGPSNR